MPVGRADPPRDCVRHPGLGPFNDRFDGWTFEWLLRTTDKKRSRRPVQTSADPWRRLVIPHLEYAVDGLNLPADTPAGDEGTLASVASAKWTASASLTTPRLPEGVIAQLSAPKLASSQTFISSNRRPSPPGGMPILIRTGNGVSASLVARWLVLIGQAGPGQKGVPMARVLVPGRLPAAQLAFGYQFKPSALKMVDFETPLRSSRESIACFEKRNKGYVINAAREGAQFYTRNGGRTRTSVQTYKR
jgi:hypothetical protein